jgi:hypothetical protein
VVGRWVDNLFPLSLSLKEEEEEEEEKMGRRERRVDVGLDSLQPCRRGAPEKEEKGRREVGEEGVR